ncbi:MAG: CocE/NonD family hydrolase [Candidatus Aminicenantes bacterium]|nr:CocE/NonD family hydrolase [Candidatus Aminicenantes bacterium]
MSHFRKNKKRASLLMIPFALFVLAGLAEVKAYQGEQISKPGEYKGYSEAIYDETARVSLYITVRDGTRLAADIHRPAVNGKPVEEPLPLIWIHTRYHRANFTEEGKVATYMENPALRKILSHGYIIAVVDVRGSGASFGTRKGIFTPEEAQDAYDIVEWFAEQPWCDGNIGMYGGSYLGITQYIAAGMAPPHLKAVMPVFALFDLYGFAYPGGVCQDDFLNGWSDLVKRLDQEIPTPPVDSDPDAVLFKKALKEHMGSIYPYDLVGSAPYRDSVSEKVSSQIYKEWNPCAYLEGLNKSNVAVYTVAGWYDMWPKDALLWFQNIKRPQKLIITPWSHSMGSEGWKKAVTPLIGYDFEFSLSSEGLRWYDYWLKGIDNGIMDEPPIYYFTIGKEENEAWSFAQTWPLPETENKEFYFREGPSGSIDSSNDGILNTQAPLSSGEDLYTVDYTTTSGEKNRWTDGRGEGFWYGDMSLNDKKALTYTTDPLEQDLVVTGHPVASLWISSTAEDGDFFVYLEEVDSKGYSHYITEGVLRASHRKISEPPFDYIGLPYHRSYKEDVKPLPKASPVELVFDLLPLSNVFDAGNRIRVTITSADQLNFKTPERDPAPQVTVFRSNEFSSGISLPIVSGMAKDEAQQAGFVLIIFVVLAVILAVVLLTWFLRSVRTRK